MVETPEHDVRSDEVMWAIASTRYREVPVRETDGRGRCCTIQPIVVRNADSCAALWPLGVLNADTLRHAQVCHPIERRTANPYLGGLGRHCPAAQTGTKDGFLPKHHGLRQTAPMIVHLLLPGWPPNLANPSHRLLTRIPLPDVRNHRILARRDCWPGLPCGNCLMTGNRVICPIGRDLRDWLGDGLQERSEERRVGKECRS